MLDFRDSIIAQAGEGPWPKSYMPFEQNYLLRARVAAELRRRWTASFKVYAIVHTRSNQELHHGPLRPFAHLQPLWAALQWSGWAVSDQEHWMLWEHRGHVKGDPKTVLELFIPQSRTEEAAVEGLAYRGVA